MSHVGALVFIVALRFEVQTTRMVRWKLLERWVHSLCRASFMHTTSTGKHIRHLVGKGYNSQRTKQWTQPIRGSSAREYGGRSSRWLWLHNSPLHSKAQGLHLWQLPVPLEGVGSWRPYTEPALGQAHNKDMRSYMQARKNDTMSYMQGHNNNTRSF